MLNIQFNGHPKRIEEGMTVEELLLDAGIPIKFCAVERNLEIVPKNEYRTLILQEGDAIEVVTLVGGG